MPKGEEDDGGGRGEDDGEHESGETDAWIHIYVPSVAPAPWTDLETTEHVNNLPHTHKYKHQLLPRVKCVCKCVWVRVKTSKRTSKILLS